MLRLLLARWHGLPNWHLAALQDALHADHVPGFAAVTVLDATAFYGEHADRGDAQAGDGPRRPGDAGRRENGARTAPQATCQPATRQHRRPLRPLPATRSTIQPWWRTPHGGGRASPRQAAPTGAILITLPEHPRALSLRRGARRVQPHPPKWLLVRRETPRPGVDRARPRREA